MADIDRIAIVGGGVFGATTAWKLAADGFTVTLFEAKDDILQCASGINQYRLHRGYHYPRSPETIVGCLRGERSFRATYEESVLDEPVEHYYAVASDGSSMNDVEITDVWRRHGLEYRPASLPIVDPATTSVVFRVRESLFDVSLLRTTIRHRLNETGVDVRTGNAVGLADLGDFDLTVVAAYGANSRLLSGTGGCARGYQFEVVEKIVLELPDDYRHVSVVVQDGPFTCIDPFGRTGLTLMGSVVHAIHARNVGVAPAVPDAIRPDLNRGVVENPRVTNAPAILGAAERFFPGIASAARHVGSMYTVRAVLPGREHDDARPTLLERVRPGVLAVFSGKIPTCVETANDVLEIARGNSPC